MTERIGFSPVTAEQIALIEAGTKELKEDISKVEEQYITRNLTLNRRMLQVFRGVRLDIVKDAQTVFHLEKLFYPYEFWPELKPHDFLAVLKRLHTNMDENDYGEISLGGGKTTMRETMAKLSRRYSLLENNQPIHQLVDEVYQTVVNVQYWKRRHSKLAAGQKS